MAEPVLKTEQVSKEYPASDFKLQPVDFAVNPGETIAFLGPNGSGKSTFFRLLSGNADPTEGGVFLAGDPLTPETPTVKRKLGYLPQDHVFPRWVTGAEILAYAAGLYNLADADGRLQQVVDYWDCRSYLHKPLTTCSHGMQKRVALALATIHEPIGLILDEPFSGLDLVHIRSLERAIARRSREQKATILSTHVAPYAAKLCDRAYVMRSGVLEEIHPWADESLTRRIELIEQLFFGPEEAGDAYSWHR